MNERNKKILCFVCLVVLGVIITHRVNHPYVETRVERLTYSGQVGTTTGQAIKGEKSIADKNILRPYRNELFFHFFNQLTHSGKVRKDLFLRPGEEDALDIDTTPEVPTQEVKILDPKPISSAPDPLNEAVTYLSSLQLLGWFEQSGQRAIFIAQEESVMVVRVGDRLKGIYVVESIEADGIKINVPDINEIIRLDTSEFNE